MSSTEMPRSGERTAVQRGLGLLLYLVGLGIGAALMGGIVWANLEARLFDPETVGERLTTLRCPLLVTPQEVATARVTVENPLDRPIRRRLRFRVAQGSVLLVEEEQILVPLEPGERRTFTWDVDPAQGVYGGRFLMVSAAVSGYPPLPARHGSCGTLVVPLSALQGIHILLLGNLLALGGMLLGLYLRGEGWRRQQRLNAFDSGLRILVGLYVLGMGTLLLGHWWALAGIALFLMGLILLGLVFRQAG